MPLWLASDPLVLASRSAVRRTLLEAAGVPVEVRPADIDERSLETGVPSQAPAAHRGAVGAAKGIGCRSDCTRRGWCSAPIRPWRLTPNCFAKPADRAAARAQLRALSRPHP